jgi:hypothetical protein
MQLSCFNPLRTLFYKDTGKKVVPINILTAAGLAH